MQKMLVGLLALMALATVVGTATHWIVGAAVVALPVTVTYVRLKLSSPYRPATDKTMTATLGE